MIARSVRVFVVAATMLVFAGLSAAQALTNSPLGTWQANGRVSAISVANGVVYLGGQFTAMISPTGQSVARAHLAAVDETTGDLLAWGPGTDGNVDALRASGGIIYAGGSFTEAGGHPRTNAAAVSTTGAVVSAWHPTPDGAVDALAVSRSTVYIGGSFTHVDGAARGRLAAVSTKGGLVAGWHPAADATVRSLTVDATTGRVYAGGDFMHISGTARRYLAALSPLTGAVGGWASDPTGRVWGIAIDGPNLYTAVGGHTPAGEVAAFDTTTGSLLWSRWTDGDAQTIAATGGSVYVGGHFINVCATNSGGGSPWVCTQAIARAKLAQFAESDGTLQAWAPPCDSEYGVWALRVATARILIGGDFKHVDNQHHWHYTEFLR